MAVKVQSLRIVSYPDPVLREETRPIETIDEEVRSVAERMIELMHEYRGVGLAAPQVGLSWRLFVANPTGEEGNDRVFINPEIREPDETQEAEEEGCLSIPGVRVQVRRPNAVTVDALDLEGNPFSDSGDGMPARVWQHELDHLNGTLIIDWMSPMDRLANRKALKELEGKGKTSARRG